MKVVDIKNRFLITGFQLRGFFGLQIDSSSNIIRQIKKDNKDRVDLILLCNKNGKENRYYLTYFRVIKHIFSFFGLLYFTISKLTISYGILLNLLSDYNHSI